MDFTRRAGSLVLAFSAAALMTAGTTAGSGLCQGEGAPNISMVTLQTRPAEGGQQMVITPRGLVVPLPGPGVDAPVVQVYMGTNGGSWYVDKNGQNVDLTAAVQRLQARVMQEQMQRMQASQIPQYAPQPYAPAPAPNQQVTINQAPASSGSSGVGSALVSGTAAMAGAMAGSAIAGTYNNVPYGTPMYFGHGGNPYFYQNGNKVFVNNSTNVAAANIHANNIQANNIHADDIHANDIHANSFEQQQKWYANQMSQHTDQAKQWQQAASSGHENPFVRPGASTAQSAEQKHGLGGRLRNREGAEGAGGGREEGGGRHRRFR